MKTAPRKPQHEEGSMKAALRWLALFALAAGALQVFFVLRIASMAVVNVQSTAFERSQAWQIVQSQVRCRGGKRGGLTHRSLTGSNAPSLPRKTMVFPATAASTGMHWRKPGTRNSRAEQRAEQRKSTRPPKVVGVPPSRSNSPKICSSPANAPCCAKARSWCLRWRWSDCCPKNASWRCTSTMWSGARGVFGAQAAALHYFRKPAQQLSAFEAARLAVMLPRPEYFEKPARYSRIPQWPRGGYRAAHGWRAAAALSQSGVGGWVRGLHRRAPKALPSQP